MTSPPTVADATVPARWPTAVGCLLLAAVVYVPAALGAQVLQFDDNFFFGPDNPEFRDGLAAVFDPSRPIANAYLPIAHASLWLDWWLGGGTPLLPHLHAMLLHALAAFVLVRFLLRLGASTLVAHAAGALFVVHPALAESVAWISGRKDLLSGLFVFAALHQTVRFAARPALPRALGITLLAVLAMYSKPTAVVLPLLVALVCAFRSGPRTRWLLPAVLLLAIAPVALHHQAIAAAEGTMAGGGGADRLAQVPGAFAHYARTAVWPRQLNVLYPEVQTLERFRADGGLGLAVLAAFAAAGVAAACASRWRLLAFGLAAFALALLPFNTAFPASSIAAADRYLYLAMPGLALAFAVLAERVLARRAWWLLAAAGLACAWLAGARAQDFRDDETLWQASLAADGENAVAHLNLVYAQQRRGPLLLASVRDHLEAAAKSARYPIHEVRARQLLVRIAVAEADYARAAREAKAAIAAAEAQLARETGDKRRAEATTWLLQCRLLAFEPLQLAGDDAAAEACHAAARALAPAHPDVIAFGWMRELAKCRDELVALAKAGKPPVLAADDARAVAADADLEKALAQHPQHAGLLCARAEWERARGQVLPAMRWYTAAETADPQCVLAWLGAARLLREREKWGEAELQAKRGLQFRPDPALRQELALALVGQGKLDEAQQQLEAFLRVHPDDVDTGRVLSNVLVGRAYAKLSDPQKNAEDIVRLVERALAYNPKEVKAHLVLGRLAKEQSRFAEAARHLERAFLQMPGYDEARELYAESLAGLGWNRLLARDEDAAMQAWVRCVEVAPPDFDTAEIRKQIERVWANCEETGVAKLRDGDRAAAVAAFRRCLQLRPTQHWASWLLAMALHDAPDADLAEVEKLAREAVAWQQQNGLDRSQQVLLLATTLGKAGKAEAAQAAARDYLRAPDADAKPAVLQALRKLAGE